MICKFCNAELIKCGSSWQGNSGWITCTVLADDGKYQDHEPAEPAAAPQREEQIVWRNGEPELVSVEPAAPADSTRKQILDELAQAEMEEGLYDRADSTPQSGNGEYCNCPGDFTDGLPFCQQCGLKARVKPEAKSTRPEPLSADIEIEVRRLLLRRGIEFNASIEQIVDATVEVMASDTRPEPLSFPLKLNQEQLSTVDEWVNDSKNLFGDKEARAINLPIFARQILSCLAAEPRAQGSESLQEWRDSVSAVIKTIPEFHSGEWSGDKEGWGFHFEVVRWLQRKREELEKQFAARPQPAPRPPACLWCEQGNKPVHRLQDGRWIEPCTAIPAQKEEE